MMSMIKFSYGEGGCVCVFFVIDWISFFLFFLLNRFDFRSIRS